MASLEERLEKGIGSTPRGCVLISLRWTGGPAKNEVVIGSMKLGNLLAFASPIISGVS